MRDAAVVRDTRYIPLAWAVKLPTLDCMSFGSANCDEASGMSWAEIVRGLSTSIINPWQWRQGVQPNMHYLLALQGLADRMGLGHLLPRMRVRN